MSHYVWMVYFGMFVVLQFVANWGNGIISPVTDATDVNAVAGYTSQQISAGSGFSAAISTVPSFFGTWLPRLLFWNYTFLMEPQFEIVRWSLMIIFDGPLVAILVLGFAGVIRAVRT